MKTGSRGVTMLRTIEWMAEREGVPVPGTVRFIDQSYLPHTLLFVETRDPYEIAEAIRTLRVRGAPAIGIAAAMGVALAAQAASDEVVAVREAVAQAVDVLRRTRPTAVNLAWALDRMQRVADMVSGPVTASEMKERLVREAVRIRDEDARMCRAIGEHGVTLLRDGMNLLTHCNAGSLATAEYGTALAPIYVAQERGWTVRVFVDETRPHLQGARLTAWELKMSGIPVTLICDNMAAVVMRDMNISAVLVGADRIAANGDTANKIGTYGLAQLARAHSIPFYVLAPTSTFDPNARSGADIPIEYRCAADITTISEQSIAPDGVEVFAPVFDVTPAALITAIVCERGVLRPPFEESIRRLWS